MIKINVVLNYKIQCIVVQLFNRLNPSFYEVISALIKLIVTELGACSPGIHCKK